MLNCWVWDFGFGVLGLGFRDLGFNVLHDNYCHMDDLLLLFV